MGAVIENFLGAAAAGLVLFGILPSTGNYQLNSYGFGSGGTANSGTATYSLEGITGEVSSQPANTSAYSVKPGYIQSQQANVPKVTLTNPSNYYDKLQFVIDAQNNPSSALYALQVQVGVGTCDFASNLFYVQSDHTLGSSSVVADYQSYASWGGAGGTTIIGLSASTTYCIRAKATQGKYTESAYGPSSSTSTSGQQISFCLYSNGTCAAGGAAEAFGGLTAGLVSNSPTNIGVDFATNADSGGNVYIYSANGGLRSVTGGYTINSATADLSSVNEGYGAQVASATQTSGGPFNAASPYNGNSNNVGLLSTSISIILNSGSPLVGGTAGIQLKAKPSTTTPSASDYSDKLTVIAAALF